MEVKISIILPVYNGEKFLPDCINSVLNQTYNDFELIIVNDGSKDKSEFVIEQIKSSKIKYYYKENGGVASARSYGINKSNGEFICFIDQDDMWENNYLKNVVQGLETSDFVYTNGHIILNKIVNGKIYDNKQTEINNENNGLKRLLEQNFIISPSQIGIRKSIVDKIGLFHESLSGSGADDWDYWIRVFTIENIRIKYIEDPLIRYRLHDSNNSYNYDKMYQCKIEIIEKHKEIIIKKYSIYFYRRIKAYNTFLYSYYNLKDRKFKRSFELLKGSIAVNPLILVDYWVLRLFVKKIIG
ncbi:glycosyl transferase family protein [Neobacillus bataviensis LMG 21833]|uniref:Glycosyl transferase family protein n=1 Tax=Neobacillus bataviensis LMG 21833 TaxID=1117379 RepID=K6ED11_9BACI|nr:glycosyltransferase family A protein [Neobacillus bataviensis]EKN71336.1 glycosyl transferase family protein [Neobacillus bataviensis LMG 21833]